MSEDNQNSRVETTDTEPQGPLGGERLAEARRERQISVAEIAKELHIDETKVRALEKNDFEVLGAPVFAKGHLRKYSEFVGINHDDVLADYYQLTRSQTIPPVITQRPKPRRELSPGPWIAAVSILIIVGIGYWLAVSRPFELLQPVAEPQEQAMPAAGEIESAEPAESAAESTAETETQQAMPEAASDPGLPQVEEPAASAPAAEAEETAPVATAAPQVAANEVRLTVTFTGDCWTEITDADGRRLYFALGRSGRTITVGGAAPLSVLFGDAENVNLEVNGEEFSIADADRRGRTARLMIYGS